VTAERAENTSEIEAVEAQASPLGRATSRLRRSAAGLPVERWLLVAGWVLLPLGVVLILLAWYGASHTTRVWQQIPYAISGGLLGLGFMLAGGFGYFAYWLTKLVDDGRRQSEQAMRLAERTAEALDRIEASLNGGASPSRRGAAAATNGALVTTAKGSMVHRPDCPMVAGKTNVRRVRGSTRGLRACMICEPDL
jgi:hypothetical protein